MNEELQGALTEILNGVLSAKDFMLAELPDVIQELLLWKFYSHLAFSMIGILLMIGSCIAAYLWWEYAEKNCSGGEEGASILAGIPAAIGFIFICENFTWLQIWLAPKVYLIEYAASLAK